MPFVMLKVDACRLPTDRRHLETLDRGVGRLQRFEAPDRADQLLELAVVSLDDVVQILDLSMQRRLRASAFFLQFG